MPDAYYRPAYARAYQETGHGTALAFVVAACGIRALIPLLRRPISTLGFANREHSADAATPYGYGGILLLDDHESLNHQQGAALLRELRECCNEAGIISAYIRLQPVTHQSAWFSNAPEHGVTLLPHGPTTAIDLSAWSSEATPRAGMSKNRITDLKLARRHLSLTWTSEGHNHGNDLQIFFRLYEQRMAEVGATTFYRFPFQYYELLAGGLGASVDIAIAWLGDEAVGVGMFFIEGSVANYHLSATNDVGRKYAANTLIIDAAARYAHDRGCRHLHLGGGLHKQDHLLAFKKSFGGLMYQYSSIGLVCDDFSYRDLVDQRMSLQEMQPVRQGFFPFYRA